MSGELWTAFVLQFGEHVFFCVHVLRFCVDKTFSQVFFVVDFEGVLAVDATEEWEKSVE